MNTKEIRPIHRKPQFNSGRPPAKELQRKMYALYRRDLKAAGYPEVSNRHLALSFENDKLRKKYKQLAIKELTQ